MNTTLLIELRTEELPPKALARLGEVFAAGVHAGLADRNLVLAGGDYTWFATPRRLAIQIPVRGASVLGGFRRAGSAQGVQGCLQRIA